jgi:signal transduction histidine kinase/CheY-like chemotaxis protein
MSTRFRLILLTLVLLLPTLGALAWGVWDTWRAGHAALDRQAAESARAMALSLDREFTRHGAIARALAASPLLDQAPRLTEHEREAFEQAARRAIQGSPVSVELVSESVRWIDTRWPPHSPPRPLGAGGAALSRSAGVHALAASGPQGAGVAVVEPVLRSGAVPVMNLKVVLPMVELRRLMERRVTNADGRAWLLDPRGQVVLRHPAAQPGGREGPLDAWVRDSLAGRAEGRFALRSVGGESLRLYFSRAPQGWTALTAVPLARFDGWVMPAPTQRLLAACVLLGLAAGALLWAARGELHRHVAAAVARTRQEERVAAGRERTQALGRLTGRMAHEFNNLLGVISNSAYLIERQATHPALAMPVAATLRAVEAASRLMQQLLRLGGRERAQPRTLALREWLPDLREMLGVVLGRRIELSMGVPDEDLCVLADPGELELAIINLALDARDALPDGGHVHLGAERAAPALVGGLPAGRYLSITLRIDGPGVAKAPGPLVLPAVPPEARVAKAMPADGPPLRARVLLTEDNETLGDVTAAMLESMGARVDRAAHAGQALDRLERGPPVDVLLTDVSMPGPLDGLGLARTVRRRWPSVRVVLISAQGHALGPDDNFPVLRKPCAPAVLKAALRRTQTAD